MEKKNKGNAMNGYTSFGFKKPVIVPPRATVASVQPSATPAEPLVARSGTCQLAKPANKGHTSRLRPPSHLSNKVADSQAQTNNNLTAPVKVTRSLLPRPQQYAVRQVAPAGYTTAAYKNAKTAANDSMARRGRSHTGGSSASSVNDADSGVGSQKSGGELEIEQLECSPSARSRLRNTQKSRPLDIVFSNKHEKKFELRDLRDSIEVTEILPLELPRIPLPKKLVTTKVNCSRDSSEDDEGIEDELGEEKLHRDSAISEKKVLGELCGGEEPVGVDEIWGHGEAMAGEDDYGNGQYTDTDLGCKAPPLRSVLLSIEDHSFAALAAMTSSTMLEDESYPELPDFQTSLSIASTSTVSTPNDPKPSQGEKNNSEGSPESPDTPTHTSNSLSLSSDIRDRDFIDDEICDQPGLVYDNPTANSSGNTIIPDEPSPKITKPVNNTVATLSVNCASRRHSSVGTLSPCESIASDDLIMDYELSAIDDDHRLDASSLNLGLTDAEGEEDGESILQELSSLVATHPELLNGVRATRQLRPRVGSSGSGADSPRSLDTPRLRSGSALSSPLRSSRQGTSSPGDDCSEDSGIRVHRGTYQSIYQDVINIKALLLRLSRMVQNSETESPHETSHRNGLISDKPDSERDMIEDLQRQVVFLQSQVEEKDRAIRCLQTTQPTPESRLGVETCNAATQTDRVRPLSTGPILSSQPDSAGGSLVSSSSDAIRPQAGLPIKPTSRLQKWRHSPHSELPKPLPLLGRRQT